LIVPVEKVEVIVTGMPKLVKQKISKRMNNATTWKSTVNSL